MGNGPKAFFGVFRSQWLAAMSGAFSVPFATLAVFADSRFAQLIWVGLAVGSAWFAVYRIWSAEHELVTQLENRVRPKISVTNILEDFRAFNRERIFELEIQNVSEDELSNCLVKLTAITLRKRNPDGEQDYSEPYRKHLPIAFMTARNFGRGGGSPFHLRAGENKKIPLFTRMDGDGKDLLMNFEGGIDDFLYRITMISTCDLEITIYGAPSPPTINLHLIIQDGVLKVTREAQVFFRLAMLATWLRSIPSHPPPFQIRKPYPVRRRAT
jgi:hypothetical protein